jgi:hypothetical protein
VRGCAAVDRSGPARAQALQAGARELDSLFGVVLGCPQDMPAGCTLRVRVGTPRVTAGRATRRIAAGERRGIGIRLSRRALRRVPAYRPPRGTPRFCGYRRLTLTLTSRSSAGTVVQERHVVRFGSSGLACGFGYVDEFFAGWSDL